MADYSVPFRIITVAETVSTNTDALELGRSGEQGPLWIIAKCQTGGKGRSGRTWLSLEGNLHASLLIVIDVIPAKLPQLSFVAGVAAFDAIAQCLPGARAKGMRIKWPNDILMPDGKLAGLLIESMSAPRGRPAVVAAGFGINIANAPSVSDQPVTAIAQHAAEPPSVDNMISALDMAMRQWLAIWKCGDGFQDVRVAWMERSGTLGELVTIRSARGTVSGYYLGLDDAGGLLLKSPGGLIESYGYGDVSLS